jgi:hypothetical protein
MLYTILTYDLKTIQRAYFECIGVDPFNGGSGNNGNGVVNSNYDNHVEIDFLLDTLKTSSYQYDQFYSTTKSNLLQVR